MSLDSFYEIIDFAIEREKEAVLFYKNLQKEVNFTAQIDILKEFERMEQNHVKLLVKVKSKQLVPSVIKEASTLNISNYLVDKKPGPNMSYQDMLIIAMKREEKAHHLYNDLSEKTLDESLKNTFSMLAAEESKHKHHFEVLYDRDINTDN